MLRTHEIDEIYSSYEDGDDSVADYAGYEHWEESNHCQNWRESQELLVIELEPHQ